MYAISKTLKFHNTCTNVDLHACNDLSKNPTEVNILYCISKQKQSLLKVPYL